MADTASKDTAAKARIISHMNTDHQREMSHYLRHYAQVSSSSARNPKLDDISFTTMTISTPSSGTHNIPIKPAMSSWADARTRAVDMDVESRAALGISDIAITSFVPLTTFNTIVAVACIYTFISMALQASSIIAPGTFFYDVVLNKLFPGGGAAYCRVQKVIGFPILAAHLAESVYMASKCEKHGVTRFSTLWWQWVSDNFFEGWGAHIRFNAAVARKRREKDGKKNS